MRRPGFRGLGGSAASAIPGLCAAALPHAAWAAEGMPQLNFGNPLTISQVVWMAIIFAALYMLLAGWGLPRVGAVLEERARTIAGDLDAARSAKAEADAAVAALLDTTRRAQAQAMAQVSAAADQAKAEAAALAGQAQTRLDAQLQQAEAQIGAARTAAMGALRQVATETATLVIDRLVGTYPDAAVVDRAVGDALAARGQA